MYSFGYNCGSVLFYNFKRVCLTRAYCDFQYAPERVCILRNRLGGGGRKTAPVGNQSGCGRIHTNSRKGRWSGGGQIQSGSVAKGVAKYVMPRPGCRTINGAASARPSQASSFGGLLKPNPSNSNLTKSRKGLVQNEQDLILLDTSLPGLTVIS
jgi:hypothetical protein